MGQVTGKEKNALLKGFLNGITSCALLAIREQ
jgi:hypothetical protein